MGQMRGGVVTNTSRGPRASDDRLREMREHAGVNPAAIVAGDVIANRRDRRLAARVIREQTSASTPPKGSDA